jgi:thioredoxin 1
MSLRVLAVAAAFAFPLAGLVPAAAPIVPAFAAPQPSSAEAQPPPVPVVPSVVMAAAHPYDEAADAHAEVEAALAEAQATHKYVLLEFGANWCPDCRALAGITELPEVKPWLDATYASVQIDIGRRTKNVDIALRYGLNLEAIPSVLVLTPDGQPVNQDQVLALGDARSMAPQEVVNLLARWASAAAD